MQFVLLLRPVEGVVLAELVPDLPVAHARHAPELGELFRHVQQLERAVAVLEHRRHHSLVFDGVERARRVHKATADFEQLRGAQCDLQLQRVQPVAVADGPPGPDIRRLAHGSVAGARHVREDGVEGEGAPARRGDDGEVLRLVVGHEQAGRVDALGLVREQVAPLHVHVVGDDEALGDGGVISERAVQHLEELERFRAGRRAHVQHDVRRLNVEEKRGDHGHDLLARDGAVLVRALDKLVDLLEVRQAAQLLPGVTELPC